MPERLVYIIVILFCIYKKIIQMLFCTCEIDTYLLHIGKLLATYTPTPSFYTCTFLIARYNTLAALYIYKSYGMEILI